MRIAVFPGSFDPFTKGHESIVRRGVELFDKVVIAIGNNTSKSYYFDLSQRTSMITGLFDKDPRIDVQSFEGLTVNLCNKLNAGFILRGLRNPTDFDYEKSIAIMNHEMNEQVESVFLMTDPALAGLSSTI